MSRRGFLRGASAVLLLSQLPGEARARLLADGEPESDAERVAHAVVLDLGEHAEQLDLCRLLDANAYAQASRL